MKDKNGIVAVSNRIFQTQLYDTFLSEMAINEKLYMDAVHTPRPSGYSLGVHPTTALKSLLKFERF